MKKLLLFVLSTFFIARINAQSSNPAPYCTSWAPVEPAGNDNITNVTFGTINNPSTNEGTDPAYVFYNNLPVPSFAAGSTYPLHATFNPGGFCGFGIWIDYNHNNVFESTEKIGGTLSNSTGFPANNIASINVTIPASAVPGNTRMRIRLSEDDAEDKNLLPCRGDTSTAMFYGGETEDYTINITGGGTTTAPVAAFSASTTTATVNNTVVTFTDQSTNAPASWAWTFTPNTVSYQNGTSAASQNPSVKFTATGSYSVKLMVTNSAGSNTLNKPNYITVGNTTSIGTVDNNVPAFNIYPNPVSDYLNIDMSSKSKIDALSIIDIQGRVIKTYNQLKPNRIDVSKLPQGTYFLKIKMNNGSIADKRFSKL